MKIFGTAALLCCLVSTVYAESTIQVVTDPAGVTISIERLDVALTSENGDHSPIPRLAIGGTPYAKKAVADQKISQDFLSFMLAVPDASALEPQLALKAEPHILTSADQLAESVKKFIDPEFGFSYRYVGIQRGVHIGVVTLNPFQLTNDGRTRALSSATLRLPFRRSLAMQSGGSSARERSLFSQVANQDALDALLAAVPANNKNVGDRTLAEDNDWFSPDRDYVKLTTTRDGIAAVSIADLGAAGAFLDGRDLRYLRLIQGGKEQPLYIADDGDDRVSAQDVVYFAGRRPFGDTSYYDVNLSSIAFYLTWDDADEGIRYRLFSDNPAATDVLSSVHVDRHVEYDNTYHLADVFVGYDHTTSLHRSETVAGEGWYWERLQEEETWEHRQLVTPVEDADEMLEFVFGFKTLTDNANYDLDHNLQFIVNGTIVETMEFNGYKREEVVASFPGAGVIAGDNLMALHSLGVEEYRDASDYTDFTAIDYVALRGAVKPFAFAGRAEFAIAEQSAAPLLRMPGFASPEVYVLDTLNNLFAQTSAAERGTTVRAGTMRSPEALSSIYVNDEAVFFSRVQGSVVAIVPTSGGDALIYTDIDEAVSAVNAAANGSAIVLLTNETTMPDRLRSLASSLGAKNLPDAAAGLWSMLLQKGAPNSVLERLGEKVTNLSAFIAQQGGRSYQTSMGLESGRAYSIMAVDGSQLERPGVASVGRDDLRDRSRQADALIVTHRNFRQQAERLAAYRREHNEVRVEVIDVDDIYNQFSNGRRRAEAIKDFLSFAYHQWAKPAPTHLILVGDASWDPRNADDESVKHDFVPSFGRPVSDFYYTLLDGDDIVPELLVGRISAETAEDVEVQIDKIIDYESQPRQPWMKRVLFLAGGETRGELAGFRSEALRFGFDFVANNPFCGVFDTVFKANAVEVEKVQATHIRNKINQGAVWVNYVGHAAPTIFDMDFGDAIELNNGSKYGVLATFSCQTAAFGEPYVVAKNEEFVRVKGKGFVATMGTTGWGNQATDKWFQTELWEGIANFKLRNLANLINHAKAGIMFDTDLASTNPFLEVDAIRYNTVMQYSLLGDPFLELPIATVPDLYVLEEDIIITNDEGQRVISAKDSTVNVAAIIRNAGVWQPEPVDMLLTREYDGRLDSIWLRVNDVCYTSELNFELLTKDMPGTHKLTIHIDPENHLEDDRPANNRREMTLLVFPDGVFALDPMPHWNIDAQSPIFRVVTPRDFEDFDYEFAIADAPDTDAIILRSVASEVRFNEAFAEWRPSTSLPPDASLWMYARTVLKEVGQESDWQIVPFVTRGAQEIEAAEYTLRNEADFALLSDNSFVTQAVADSAQLSVDNRRLPMEIISGGFRTTRRVKIAIGETVYIDSIFARGVHLMIMPKATTEPRFFQRFDIYKSDTSRIRELLTLLQEGIGDDETLIFVTCDETWRQIKQFDYIEEYRAALRLHGAEFADSLREHSSYILISEGKVRQHEHWRNGLVDPEPLSFEDVYEVFVPEAGFSSPVVGPAQRWLSFDLALASVGDVEVQATVFAFDKSGQRDSLFSVSNASIDLSTVDAEQYPYLQLRLHVKRVSDDSRLTISDLAINYLPEPEFAVMKLASGISNNDVLRGEETDLRLQVRNISPRVSSRDYRINVDVRPASSQSAADLNFSLAQKALAPDATWDGIQTIPTALLANASEVFVSANPTHQDRELYLFNNEARFDLDVREDVTPPQIVVLVDGVPIRDGQVVQRLPNIEVQLLDDSPLPIVSESNLLIQLRRRGHDDPNTFMSNFGMDFPNDDPLKVSAHFDANLLVAASNPLTVTAVDATGNSTTATFNLNVARSAQLNNVTISPNPVENESIIAFTIVDNIIPLTGTVRIFNVTGRRVATLAFQPQLGRNVISWNGRNANGESLAAGMYLLVIEITGGSDILVSDAQALMYRPD